MFSSRISANREQAEQEKLELLKQVEPPRLDSYRLLDWSFEAVRWQQVEEVFKREVCLDSYICPTVRGISTVLEVKPTRVKNAVARLKRLPHLPAQITTQLKAVDAPVSLRVVHPDYLLGILADLADRKPRVQIAIDIVLAVRNRWSETEFSDYAHKYLPKRTDYGQR